MLDFEVVDHAAIWPQKCAICTNQKGPMVDTHSETLDGRVYICLDCVCRCAVKAGLVDGEQKEKLMDAMRVLAEAEAGLVKKDKTIAKYKESLAGSAGHITQQDQEIANLRGQVDQLQHIAKQFQTLAQEIGMVGV
jgi:regulator of RNase E activity RraB